MATTTNYGWDTPDDTDLVKDGAAAIRTLGSSADTTTKNLNPQTTTGALAYRSATANVNTALPIGTTGQVLRVNSGGTAPEWATTADQTPLTTKGDLFTFSTVDARLGVGANNTILVADSNEATGLKWAPAAGVANGNSTVATRQSTSSSSYNDLTTVQSVTLTTGTKALVLLTTKVRITSVAVRTHTGFTVSGATSISASDAKSIQFTPSIQNESFTVSGSFFVNALTAGSNTFTMKFRSVGGTTEYEDRQITVIDLGS